MKICPVCKAPNKDSNASCLDCGHFLGGTPVVDDQGYMDAQLNRAARKGSRKKLLLILLGIVAYALLQLFFLYLHQSTFGHIQFWGRQIWMSIPAAFLFFFPYDRCYSRILRAMGKPEKHLPEYIRIGLVILGIVFLFFIIQHNYQMLNILPGQTEGATIINAYRQQA